MASIDGLTWLKVATLEPTALRPVFTKLSSAVQARFIAVEHQITERKYAKAYVWEIDAYDEHGRWGPLPKDSPNVNSLKEMFGVNGIWGWGNNKYSTHLGQTSGPKLYNQIASHARNYHNLGWDVKDPDNKPGYVAMAAGHGTNGESWLNWDTEYRAWVESNLSVDASIQFTSKGGFPPSIWDNPYQDSYNYGKDFATHFGPTNGTGMINAMEVGNEPWDYPASFYATVLDGMSKGAKAGDKKLLVMPGAFQAHDKFATSNYIGTRVKAEFANNVDIINGHFYSFKVQPDGTRTMSYPEDPESEFNGVINLLRWCELNMQGKPVWITEWGWDSTTSEERCRYAECVSEDAQAIYGLRGLMMLARLGVQKATWFFYADSKDCDNHIFCRSGLTANIQHKFAKKKVFHSFQRLFDLIGDKHFLKVVKEDQTSRVYMFGEQEHDDWRATHLVVWRPVDANDSKQEYINFHFGTKPDKAWRIRPGNVDLQTVTIIFDPSSKTVSLPVGPEPIVIEIKSFPLSHQDQIIG